MQPKPTQINRLLRLQYLASNTDILKIAIPRGPERRIIAKVNNTCWYISSEWPQGWAKIKMVLTHNPVRLDETDQSLSHTHTLPPASCSAEGPTQNIGVSWSSASVEQMLLWASITSESLVGGWGVMINVCEQRE